jgi:hypothetical protein
MLRNIINLIKEKVKGEIRYLKFKTLSNSDKISYIENLRLKSYKSN